MPVPFYLSFMLCYVVRYQNYIVSNDKWSIIACTKLISTHPINIGIVMRNNSNNSNDNNRLKLGCDAIHEASMKYIK